MTTVEPGTYRIVNLARNKAIRVPDEYPDTIASWHTQDDANQKWVVERAGGGYCFKSSVHGRYISVNGTQCDSRAYHGQSPTTWKIVPHTPSGYFIQLEAADRVLDLHDRGEVYLWPKGGGEPQKIWNFEKLDDDASDELNQEPKTPVDRAVDETQSPTLPTKAPAEQNGEASEQIALKEKVIADQNQQLSEQAKQLEDLRRQVEARDSELAQARRDIEALSSQQLIKSEDPRETKQAKTSPGVLVESEEGWVEENGDSGEVSALREEVKRLEDLLAQVFDPEHEPTASNNVA